MSGVCGLQEMEGHHSHCQMDRSCSRPFDQPASLGWDCTEKWRNRCLWSRSTRPGCSVRKNIREEPLYIDSLPRCNWRFQNPSYQRLLLVTQFRTWQTSFLQQPKTQPNPFWKLEDYGHKRTWLLCLERKLPNRCSTSLVAYWRQSCFSTRCEN